jgi:hypothetical protein
METFQHFVEWLGTLPTIAKTLMTAVIVLVAGFVIAVMWLKGSKQDESAKWPTKKTIETLKNRLDAISKENARLLVVVASSDQYGIYLDDLSKRLDISRAEAQFRSKELETDGLLEVLSLTDLNIRLTKDVQTALAPNPSQFLSAYLNVHLSPTVQIQPTGNVNVYGDKNATAVGQNNSATTGVSSGKKDKR